MVEISRPSAVGSSTALKVSKAGTVKLSEAEYANAEKYYAKFRKLVGA